MDDIALKLETEDGVAPLHVFHPVGPGSWPAILFYMDGLGIRPALFQMARRLAERGYYVLLPDLYYRAGAYGPFDAAAVFGDPEGADRKRVTELYTNLTNAMCMRDTAAYLSFLERQAAVRGPKIGCVGYCMGGAFALTAAGTYPERVAAAASFHGARLATDQPDSPHLLAPQMRAQIYVGIAGIDPHFPTEERDRLEAAFSASGVAHTVEVYEQVHHGFAVSDTPVFDQAASDRHWTALLKLFGETLSPTAS